MRATSPNLSLASREELAQFAQWVQDIDNGTIAVQSTINEASGLGETSVVLLHCVPEHQYSSQPFFTVLAKTPFSVAWPLFSFV